MPYLPIGNYGVIGDLRSVALVGTNGSIDWWCYPHFDSPSAFGAILDDQIGGCFQVRPVNSSTAKQLYIPDTNVLLTRFLASDGVCELTDFMPVRERHAQEIAHKIVRRVEAVRGRVKVQIRCAPAFDYARARHTVTLAPAGAIFEGPFRLGLATTAPLRADGDAAVGEMELAQGEVLWLELEELAPGAAPAATAPEQLQLAFSNTVHYWRKSLAAGHYGGRWREVVNRSALVLKLLTFQPTGGIVAAATTSLPEHIGGVRNWDYRYTWIRDASFTLYGLLRLGFGEEAKHFMDWLSARLREHDEADSAAPMHIMYSLHGDRELQEQTLDHLGGYQQSRPVRVGNGAYSQKQLDVYGELMDAVYLYNKHVQPIGYDMWRQLTPLLEYVCDHWHEPDEGIWEVRGPQQHFVYSKVMCWVALDRGLRLAEKRSFPAPRARWTQVRDQIYEDVMTRGWSKKRNSFVQAYGSEALDASNLIMPLVFFLSPTDPRMQATLDATLQELVSDSLVQRYRLEDTNDGLPGEEGSFSICTFWLVEAMTRAGRVDEARIIFEKMLTYANHLGLYSEEIGRTGELLGNYPQAFTHLALISAAYNLNQALDRRRH
ncbi:MAG: glucoamylase [Deltaproteobacteria bacterium RBG_16_71_12]|nr:MAG: glucoamylase [Deltaproteobacteria bacterium RBG_16_71_12]